jgi:ParB family transcriptional regulator, chromosome partitioning protein
MATTDKVSLIPTGSITPNPYQPRLHFDETALTELAESIRHHGVIQPIIVRPAGNGYQVIAGERRLRAALRLGLGEIPAIVRPYTDEQALEAALIENLQRADISVVETARAYQRLADEFFYTQGEIALRTGKSRAAVANTIRLLQLPEAILEQIERGDLSEGHARALLGLPTPSLQQEAAEWAIRNGVNVRELESKVRQLTSGTAAARPETSRPSDALVRSVEDRLRQRFGTKVELEYRKGRGAITLEFYSEEDLERLLHLLGLV